MFGSSWWVYPEVDGVRVCYAKAPTFRCPLLHRLQQNAGESLARAAERQRLPIAEAAAVLSIDPTRLAGALRRAHQNADVRARVDGKPTDRCAGCGHKLERLGFRCWIEQRVPADERTEEQRASAAINSRLGLTDGSTWRTTRSLYLDTKREAATWAREEHQTRKAAAAEVTA